jgi:hypothetical protein
MRGSISVYSFDDGDGMGTSMYTTQDYREAVEFAQQAGFRVVENVYEWVESVPLEVADFTDKSEEEETE